MEPAEPLDPRREKLLPVVAYAVERRIATSKPDYWDHVTRLELAVLAKDAEAALNALEDALDAVRESWEAETTTRNLRLISEARKKRGEAARMGRKNRSCANRPCKHIIGETSFLQVLMSQSIA